MSVISEDLAVNSCDKFTFIKGVYLPKNYINFANAIENFKIRDDDVWVCSFPKTGTTWTQEMVWCIGNELDFESAKVNITERFPYFELITLLDDKETQQKYPHFRLPPAHDNSLEYIEQLPSPRFIKSHLPFHLLPRDLKEGKTKAKIIYVTRNPKDVCISYWHHRKLTQGYSGDLQDFCQIFLEGKLSFSPFWDHVVSYWNERNNSKLEILYLRFEEMRADLSWVIRRTSKFLGKSLLSYHQTEILLDHLSYSNMRKNPAINYENAIIKNSVNEKCHFIRCGETDQWKTAMPPETSDKFDEKTESYHKSSVFIF